MGRNALMIQGIAVIRRGVAQTVEGSAYSPGVWIRVAAEHNYTLFGAIANLRLGSSLLLFSSGLKIVVKGTQFAIDWHVSARATV
jgi:hypothetical protein